MIIYARSICVVAVFFVWSALQGINQVNLIGFLDDLDSLSRHTSSFIDCLHQEKDLHCKLFKNRLGSARDLSLPCIDVFNQAINVCNSGMVADHSKKSKPLRGMVIYTEPFLEYATYEPLIGQNTIRIASVVYETTKIPPSKVAKLNAHSDAVIVPDAWLVDVYKNSGVTCPVFSLPLVLNLNSLLTRPIKKQRNSKFVFGFSGFFLPHGRKNHECLLESFAEEFGGQSGVMLQLHGRGWLGSTLQSILTRFNQLQITNIALECKSFNRREYENFLASLDCYVSVAKGEGFSIIPREVLALGIPCILANNTAQRTICSSGLVCSIVSELEEKALLLGGNWFATRNEDLRAGLRDVYENYDFYLQRAHQGREWVKQYLAENLTKKYRSLVAPSRVILGDRNEIADDYLMTDSPELFAKYKKLYSASKAQFHVLGSAN